MYPNQYCKPCNDPQPCVEVPAPPDCIGEPCDEIVLDTCVRYTGPDIPCLGITTGTNINQIVQIIAARLCDCCDGTPPVVDCEVSEWSEWSECVDGVQTRTRTVIQSPQNGGAECPDLIETRECCTPVDCVVSDWSAWSVCDGTERTRTRTVITPASCGGVACPVLIETESCTLPIPCPDPEVNVDAAGCDSFVVTIGHNATAPTVTMEYQQAGASTWTIGGMLTTTLAGPNTITIIGLNSNTTYNVRVKTKCVDGDSAWVTIPVVIPVCATCSPLENIFVESDNCETAFVSFDDDGTATVLYGELFNSTAPTVVVSTKIWTPLGSVATYSHTFTGLPAGTYFVKLYKDAGTAKCDTVLTANITVVDCPLECPVPTNLGYVEVCDHTNNGITATATVTGATVLSLSFELYNVTTAGDLLVDTQSGSVVGGGSASVNFFNLGLIAGEPYKVVVKTICEMGQSTTVELPFIKAACKPAPLDCLAPTNLTVS